MSEPKVYITDLGLMDYKEAWDLQDAIFQKSIQQKLFNRDHPEKAVLPSNQLLFVEHPHVYTLGKSGSEENLIIKQNELFNIQATYYKINRGGDITYHGPGQMVFYPILDLDQFFTDIHLYLRYLEDAVINTLADYGIISGRVEGLTGVWIDGEDSLKARKICAMGIRTSRWVTMHGIALNVNTDLSYFANIVPCGITDKAVTSMQKELGKEVNIKEVEKIFLSHFMKIFKIEHVSSKTLAEIL
jgi:lipoyl(octanoyl) transferase